MPDVGDDGTAAGLLVIKVPTPLAAAVAGAAGAVPAAASRTEGAAGTDPAQPNSSAVRRTVIAACRTSHSQLKYVAARTSRPV